MERPLTLKLFLDERPVSQELQQYMNTLASMTEKLAVEVVSSSTETETPCVRVCLKDGSETGLAFHGVPGGHEFTSFILGLYNASGPGQAIDPETEKRILEISAPIHLKILVSLSCTMCPELVTAAQKIASLNPNVFVDVYDLNHFEGLKNRYQVMSVPCFVINEKQVHFGKKNIRQLLDMLS